MLFSAYPERAGMNHRRRSERCTARPAARSCGYCSLRPAGKLSHQGRFPAARIPRMNTAAPFPAGYLLQEGSQAANTAWRCTKWTSAGWTPPAGRLPACKKGGYAQSRPPRRPRQFFAPHFQEIVLDASGMSRCWPAGRPSGGRFALIPLDLFNVTTAQPTRRSSAWVTSSALRRRCTSSPKKE